MNKRVTVINNDNDRMDVIIDGEAYYDLPLALPKNVHAVQWYGEHGEVEYMDRNEEIKDFHICSDAMKAVEKYIEEEKERLENVKIPEKPDNLTDEEYIREIRGGMLDESDWVVNRSFEEGIDIPEAWREYRNALRDIPSQEGFPYEVDWPTPPSSFN